MSWKSFLQHPMSVWWIYGWSSVSWCLSSRSGWGLAMFCTCCAVVMYWRNFAMLKVTLTTVAELYNDDGNTINHHGFKRKIMKEGGKVKNPLCGHVIWDNFVIRNYICRLAMMMKWPWFMMFTKYRNLLVGIVTNIQIWKIGWHKIFSETKVVPIFAVLFTIIYWGVAINFYLDKWILCHVPE